jgi:hypothetical protein
MYFNRWKVDGGQGVPNGHTGMGVCGRIDNDALKAAPGLLNPRDQFPFLIGLPNIKRDSKIFAELQEGRIDGVESGRSIDGFFPGPEQIEIRTMQDQHAKHVSYEQPPTDASDLLACRMQAAAF